MNREKSSLLFKKAKDLMPGGVNSPVRAFQSVNDTPFFVKRAQGAYIYDIDGNEYLDYVSSWGAIILGHSDEGLIEIIKDAVKDGTSYGACHPAEVEIAQIIIDAFPSMELVRLTSSGTEATMSAIRLARGFTKKKGIIKFRGCYHGHVDSLLVKAGSGLETFGMPDSGGVPEDLAKYTYVAEFNHIETVEKIIQEHDDIACLILEPVMGNMGVILPSGDFLKEIQKICRRNNVLLICDEVITGFRVTYGGAQHVYDIDPDITCLGKIIGGGFGIGAFGGSRRIMEELAPIGNTYQAGTLSGNPIAVKAGIYTLKFLRDHREIYDQMNKRVEDAKEAVLGIAHRYGIPYRINSTTGMFTGFFSRTDVNDYQSAAMCDRKAYEGFFKSMLENGIFFAPSQFEASILTLCHKEKEFLKTIESFEKVFKTMTSS